MKTETDNKKFIKKCEIVEKIAKECGYCLDPDNEKAKDDGFFFFHDPPVVVDVDKEGNWIRYNLIVTRGQWDVGYDIDKLHQAITRLMYKSFEYDRKNDFVHYASIVPKVPDVILPKILKEIFLDLKEANERVQYMVEDFKIISDTDDGNGKEYGRIMDNVLGYFSQKGICPSDLAFMDNKQIDNILANSLNRGAKNGNGPKNKHNTNVMYN